MCVYECMCGVVCCVCESARASVCECVVCVRVGVWCECVSVSASVCGVCECVCDSVSV